jgi:hypothetical protein
MTQIDHYVMQCVESFPTPLDRGILYVSLPYSTAGHICPCGCGREVVTKLSPARYRIIFDGEVSLQPSVAATGLPCNSHYLITRGAVDWHARLNTAQAARTQAADRQAVEVNRTATPQPRARRWKRIWGQRKARSSQGH